MKYLFLDLDGTVCESKQRASDEMIHHLNQLSYVRDIFIVSGASVERMMVQVPLSNITLFGQNGNSVYKNGRMLWQNELKNKDAIHKHIDKLLNYLKIKKIDDMVEDRGSQISLSLVGHNAQFQKKKDFDPDKKKRTALLEMFPFPNALIGGTTTIDYIPGTKGQNIQRYLDEQDISPVECLYIGDALQGFGNDATVCGIIPTFEVRGPEDTLRFIKQL